MFISSSNSFVSKVCDGTTSVAEPCDELCGGAGCNQCGGISCLKGALSKAEDSVKSATAADEMLVEKDRKAAQVCNSITVNFCNLKELSISLELMHRNICEVVAGAEYIFIHLRC